VFDPTMNVQSILNTAQDTAQEVAKFVEMINNQVQQIQTLTDQSVQPLVNDLRKTEVGET